MPEDRLVWPTVRNILGDRADLCIPGGEDPQRHRLYTITSALTSSAFLDVYMARSMGYHCANTLLSQAPLYANHVDVRGDQTLRIGD